MPRRFLAVTLCLTAVVGLLVGLNLAGRLPVARVQTAAVPPATRADAFGATPPRPRLESARSPLAGVPPPPSPMSPSG